MADERAHSWYWQPTISRRTFLVWSGVTAGAVAYPWMHGGRAGAAAPDSTQPAWFAAVRRPDDQCVLTLLFYNLEPDFTADPVVLTKVNPERKNFLAVEFGPPTEAGLIGADPDTVRGPTILGSAPMHVAEKAYPLTGGNLTQYSQQPTRTPKPTGNTVQAPPVPAEIAGPSRLVFEIPDSLVAPAASDPLQYTTTDLLSWVSLLLSVAPNALGNVPPGFTNFDIPPPQPPTVTETAIELPFGLIISPPQRPSASLNLPNDHMVFVNATAPVTHGEWTELWHTRYAAVHHITIGHLSAALLDENDPRVRIFRAIWCTDPNFPADFTSNRSIDPTDDNYPGFANSLEYRDRYDIVRLSSDFTPAAQGGPYGRTGISKSGVPLGTPFIPAPATAQQLMLTSLGGWLDSDAHWDLPNAQGKIHGKPQYNSSLLAWRHRAVQGRDSYVRVVRKGYLFPWGHRASLITVTERELTATGTTVGAYLRQKTFLVVGQPIKYFGEGTPYAPYDGRKIPFTSVEALTLVTPDLDAPHVYSSKAAAKLLFEPKLNHQPFLFHLRGIDWAGDPVDFRSPVLWVDDTISYDTSDSSAVTDAINTWRTKYPTIELHNNRVSLATPKDPETTKGDTQVVATSFELGVDHTDGATPSLLVDISQPAFFPAMHTVTVSMSAAKSVSGNDVGSSVLEYENDHYLTYGFPARNDPNHKYNKGGIFLQLVPTETRNAITFQGDKSGGSITPNLHVDGISRELGPVSTDSSGDLDNLAKGRFHPAQVFSNVNAKLLGGLDLSTILKNVDFGDGTPGANAQAMSITSLELENPHRVVTTVDWHPVIQNGGPTIGSPPNDLQITIFEVRDPDEDGGTVASNSLDLHAVIVARDDPTQSHAIVTGQLRDFNLDLFGKDTTYFLQIPFDSLTFRAETGKKTDVDVEISADGVSFQGALSFVQELATYLNFGGSGLVIDTSGPAITAVLTLAIPSIGMGVFALENIAFSAGVAIPYNGDPVRVTFGLCSRENPFQLEIMMFTGGGYVGLGVGVDGVELLEFGFDFGLGISIDIGIASGQVSLVGGIDYEANKQSDGTQEVDLTAYVKASGGISALGVVSVSIEFYLTLQHHDPGNTLAGQAEMSISVHVLCFGGTVGFTVQESFSGNSSSAVVDGKSVHPDNDPGDTFGDVLTSADWDEYCTAFALVGVGV